MMMQLATVTASESIALCHSGGRTHRIARGRTLFALLGRSRVPGTASACAAQPRSRTSARPPRRACRSQVAVCSRKGRCARQRGARSRVAASRGTQRPRPRTPARRQPAVSVGPASSAGRRIPQLRTGPRTRGSSSCTRRRRRIRRRSIVSTRLLATRPALFHFFTP